MLSFLPNPLLVPVGFAIGVLVAAPVGPVNVLCIQRSAERGFWGGVAAGLGAVLGDGLIALFAALGVGAISGAFEVHRTAIQLIGGLALLAFGVRLLVTTPRLVRAPEASSPAGRHEIGSYLWDIPQTFLLTITNPASVLGLFVFFGGLSSFVEVRGRVDALTFVAAIMTGSLAWWMTLAHLIGRFRNRLTEQGLARINRVAGIALIGFGLLVCGEIALKHLVPVM